VGGATDAPSGQLPADLPGEDRGVLPLAPNDRHGDRRGEEAGPAASDGLGLHPPRRVEPTQDLADATDGHLFQRVVFIVEQYFKFKSSSEYRCLCLCAFRCLFVCWLAGYLPICTYL